MTALMYANQERHAECVRVLIVRGANLEAVDKLGNTPLECAEWSHNAEVHRERERREKHVSAERGDSEV